MTAPDPMNLKGHVAFVTGAGQGAGRAIALAFARHNVSGVAVNDFVAERAAAVVAELKQMGVPAVAVPADVGDLDAVNSAMAIATDTLGPITLLVNNAGNAGPSATMGLAPPFWETGPDDWERYMHTNLKGVMNCCHASLPTMVNLNRGRIVTIISDAGRVGEARLAAYSAAKAGAAGFTRALARETGRYGVTVNAVSLSTLEPALDENAMTAFLESERTRNQLARYAIRRFGKPEDVANMVLFLCSDGANWITGQTYPVNGGYSFTL